MQRNLPARQTRSFSWATAPAKKAELKGLYAAHFLWRRGCNKRKAQGARVKTEDNYQQSAVS